MEGFLIAARTLHFTSAISLTGVLAFERLVAIPAFLHSRAIPASAAGLRRRLGWLAWASLALALVSGAAWLVAVAAGMSGNPLGVALSQGAVTVVLTRTRFGEDWLLRFALAVLLGLCLLGTAGGLAERSVGLRSSSPRRCWRASHGPAMVRQRPARPEICTLRPTSCICSLPGCGWGRSRP